MEKDTIKSTLKLSTILILVFGGIGMLVISYFMLSSAFNSEYPQIAGLVLGGFFGLLGLGAAISLLFLETLELDKEKLVVMSILGFPKRIIYRKDIVSYNEIEKENKGGRWFDLTIFTDREKYKISSSLVSNYVDFKRVLIEGKPRNVPSEQIWHSKTYRNFGVAGIVFGVLLLYFFWNVHKNGQTRVLPNELTTIKVTTKNTLVIESKKASQWITINTNEYSTFNFELTGTAFYAARSEQLVENVKKGDLIELDVTTDEYEKKFTKTKPLTFWDKTYNYNVINIYGVRHKNQSYLTLDAYNDEHKRDSASLGFWFFVMFGIGAIATGIYLLLYSKMILSTQGDGNGSQPNTITSTLLDILNIRKTQPEAKRAGVTLYPGKIVIETVDSIKDMGGVVTTNLTILKPDSSSELIGQTLRRHLEQSRDKLKKNTVKEDRYSEYLKAAGFKNKTEHHRNALYLDIYEKDGKIHLGPTINGGPSGKQRGFANTKDEMTIDKTATDRELGDSIRQGWSKCVCNFV